MKILVFTVLFTFGTFLVSAQSTDPPPSQPPSTPKRSSEPMGPPPPREPRTTRRPSEQKGPPPPLSPYRSPTTTLRPRGSAGASSSRRLSTPPSPGETRISALVAPVNKDLIFRGRLVYAAYYELFDEFFVLKPNYQLEYEHGAPKVVKLQDLEEDDLLVRDKHMIAFYSVRTHQFIMLPENLRARLIR
ncbi:T-box transcription factor TBX1-like [Belonocnema kinseyi]|uniref:T-box transcription factor TBX1-like n=1 Tax=Belonocnema kinseyi TaxID=2817044 RepID=UPI00143D074D|nr:T-box transcription factor TBX1-like [Belonocnema kinseyi]